MNMLDGILAAITPALIDIGGLIAAAAAAFIVKQISDVLGGIITDQMRTRLHQALENGFKAALASGLRGDKAELAAVEYAKTYVPAAIRKLKVDDLALGDLVKSKVGPK